MTNRRKVLKKLKHSTAMKEAYELDYNKDGSVQINVGIRDADDFFSPYCYKTYELMNPDVSNYINMCEASIPEYEVITIDIHTETSTTPEEKKRIRHAVKRFHAEEIVILKKRLKRKTLKGILYSLFGTAILLIAAFFAKSLMQVYLDAIFAVMGWMFLWDGVEVLLEDRGELKRKLLRSYRILNAKVHVRQYNKQIRRQYKLGKFEEEDDD